MQLIKLGGLKEDASIEDINLAYKLEDGMKIHIPTAQEILEQKKKNESEDSQESDLTEQYTTTSSGLINSTEGSGENSKNTINSRHWG